MKRVLFLLFLMQAVCFGALRADINRDGRVDIKDLAILASEWLMEETDMQLGPELVANGGFGSSASWQSDEGIGFGNWSISEGKARCVYLLEDYLFQELNGAVAGKTYRLTYTLVVESLVAGYVSAQVAGITNIVQRTISGTYTQDFVAGVFEPGDSIEVLFGLLGDEREGTFTIDDVSVREVLPAIQGDELSEAWTW
jgi:hypothetical protein